MQLTELWVVRMPEETMNDASQIVEHHDDMGELVLMIGVHSVWTTEKEAITAAESLLEARRLKEKRCDVMLAELIELCIKIQSETFVALVSSHNHDERQWSNAFNEGVHVASNAIIGKLISIRG